MTRQMPSPKTVFTGICALYFVLALVYSWATPPFESSDEYKHYPVVQYIQQAGELVVLDPDNEGKWKQEGAQPPLYYLMMAAATSWIDTSDLAEVHRENRHAFIGNAAQIKNKNLVFHDPQAERFPWEGSILAVYVIRVLSIGLGVGTLWFGWQTAQLFFEPNTALAVVALTAFNPMFLFISAAVNNDSLSVMLGAAGLFVLVKLWQAQSAQFRRMNPAPEARSLFKQAWVSWVIMGMICGLAMLTKLSLATLLLLAGWVTVRGMFLAWGNPSAQISWVKQAAQGLLTLGIALALVGPWLLRNWRLYGDLTGLAPFIAVQGTRQDPTLFGVDWIAEFGTFFRSYWGLFGGVNVFAPQWFYTVCNLLMVLGLVGLVVAFLPSRRERDGWNLPVLVVLITMILLINWTIISPAFQGRLLFPALIGVNVLWVKGLQVAGGKWQVAQFPLFPFLTTLFFLGMAIVIPFTHIAPAYAYPEPVTVPAEAEFGPITYTDTNGESLSLVGVALEPGQTAVPNDQTGIAVTLYWTTETGVTTDYVTAVHTLGRELESVGQIDRHPGWGMWPPTRWEPGEIYADPYHVWVNPGSEDPALLRIKVSVSDTSGPEHRNLTATSAAGDVIDLVLVGEAKLAQTLNGDEVPSPFKVDPVSHDFADFVTLRTSANLPFGLPGEPYLLWLEWRANGTPRTDYTVFVQVLNADGELIASGDAPPLNGDYPTRLWEAGEQIWDRKEFVIPKDTPAGNYRLLVGLYDPITGARMQLLEGGDFVEMPLAIR